MPKYRRGCISGLGHGVDGGYRVVSGGLAYRVPGDRLAQGCSRIAQRAATMSRIRIASSAA